MRGLVSVMLLLRNLIKLLTLDKDLELLTRIKKGTEISNAMKMRKNVSVGSSKLKPTPDKVSLLVNILTPYLVRY